MVYVLVAKGMLRVAASPMEVNWFLDRIWMLYLLRGCIWREPWCWR